MFNNLNILFFFMMILSTLISISSSNWLGVWMGLEINMISFIPLIITTKNILSNESAIKYFLIQASSSSLFLMTILFNSFNSISLSSNYLTDSLLFLLATPLMIKMAAAPFQQWFINIMSGMTWAMCYTVSTWQKITPLFILNYLIHMNNMLIILFIILSTIVGALGGITQTLIKKIIAYSSVNHLGWLMTTLLLSKKIMLFYMFFYMILNAFVMFIFNLNNIIQFTQINTKILFVSFVICMMSLGGLPPFLGFMPKLMLIKMLLENNLFNLSMILVATTLVTLFFYLRMTFSIMNLSSISQKWYTLKYPNKNILIYSLLTVFSSLGLVTTNLFLF
uniref:NADH-ubiquinone oxidoreductase chain 2 n=1 Tax=Graphocaecilius interpretatus TaxID=2596997 RepID=A0A8K1ZFK8_9NEOP|nr:NADH dehydrogenase subunit 2 [Graphocaecilius interpretatus]